MTSITFVTELRGIAAALAATGDAVPSLALTIDGGSSWMAVTGLSGLAALPSPAQAPDLVATWCAPLARTLCVAAGGYLPSAAGLWSETRAKERSSVGPGAPLFASLRSRLRTG